MSDEADPLAKTEKFEAPPPPEPREPMAEPPELRDPNQEPPVKRGRRERILFILKWVGVGLGAAVVLAALAVVLVIRHYEAGLPSVETLKRGYDPPQVTRVLARDGSVLASLFIERRTVIPFGDIPRHAKLAFLAAEDASFYEHEGLDYFGMLRALLVNLRAGRAKQGASTITQQVIKNVVLGPERSYERKIKETILARRLEQSLTKDEIFGLYLNHIYLGHGRYGIEEATRYYFGKKARDLELAEAATLAGLVASPERYSPRHDAEKALTRRRFVLDQMLEKGFLTSEPWQVARDVPLRLAPAADGESELAPEVVAQVKKILEQVAGERARLGGFVVKTTLDPAMQIAARRAVRDALAAYATRQKLEPPFAAESRRIWGKPPALPPKPETKAAPGRVVAVDDAARTVDVEVGGARCRVLLGAETRYNPKRLSPSEFTRVGAALRVVLETEPGPAPVPCRLALGPEAALVAIDVRTREIRALVGSYDAVMGSLDRATRARRQPGSAFKPFVYGYALSSRRFTPASVLTLPNRPEKPRGDAGALLDVPPTRTISLRLAIAKSDNDAATKLLAEVGAPNVVGWARALGIESDLRPTPSLALGAYEVTPLEITNAFVSFANGGEVEAPRLVLSIQAPGGKELPLPPTPPRRRVMTAEEAYLTTSLLRSVVDGGTGQRAKALGRPAAGKTGTTNEAKDTWFVGYTTELVTGVWVGYDDPIPLGWGEAGSATALPAWLAFMKAAHEGHPSTDFPRSAGIAVVAVDPATGLIPYPGQTDSIEEEFLEGTVPTEVSVPAAGSGVPDAGPPDAGVDDEARESRGALPELPSVPVDAAVPPPF
ncbi:MAG TPA: transglycosylase domain-containing protein [Polyangiaceae bacterium]